jgi:nucleoside-triphosphatase THEP1
LKDEEATIAHVDFRTPYKVGRYGVDVRTIDRLAESALTPEFETPEEGYGDAAFLMPLSAIYIAQ